MYDVYKGTRREPVYIFNLLAQLSVNRSVRFLLEQIWRYIIIETWLLFILNSLVLKCLS